MTRKFPVYCVEFGAPRIFYWNLGGSAYLLPEDRKLVISSVDVILQVLDCKVIKVLKDRTGMWSVGDLFEYP